VFSSVLVLTTACKYLPRFIACFVCCSTKSRVRGHLRLYLGYFTPNEGSESPSADSPTPPSLEVQTVILSLADVLVYV